MTDWKLIAQARGLEPDERVTLPLQSLETQFSALRAQIRLETEPVTHHVLPLPEAGK
ncbi:MAG TPA: hypothetical protein VFQ91_07865 [Bryobacteraceae bacterium]|nr:hypothetical protein [Bryobacteraceae bacterium]